MLFGIFKDTVDKSIVKVITDVLDMDISKELIVKLTEAHSISKAVNGEVADIKKSVAALEKAVNEKSNAIHYLHFFVTVALLFLVILK